MKEIKAVIRPSKLPALRDALRELNGFPGMTVSKVDGCSAPHRHIPRHKIEDDLVDFTPKVRIEIITADEYCDPIVDCIINIAKTGHVGDGLVWVTEVQRAVFIFKTTAGTD